MVICGMRQWTVQLVAQSACAFGQLLVATAETWNGTSCPSVQVGMGTVLSKLFVSPGWTPVNVRVSPSIVNLMVSSVPESAGLVAEPVTVMLAPVQAELGL